MPRSSAQSLKHKKKTRKFEKSVRRVKKFVLLSSLFIFSAIFLSIFAFYKKLTTEFTAAFSSSSFNISTEDFYTILKVEVEDFSQYPINTNSLALYIVDVSTSKLIKYEIPLDTRIDVPGRFGEEPFRNIFSLGSLEGASTVASSELVMHSVSKLLAFPVDRYILVEKEASGILGVLLDGSLNISKDFDFELFRNSIKTNMTLQELFNLYKFTNSLPSDRFINKEYGEIYQKEPLKLDEELMDITFDTAFSNEKKSIAVLNGSETSGIANFGSRIVTNLGGRVVATGNSTKMYEKSVLVTDNLTSQSTRMLKHVFNIEKVYLNSEVTEFNDSEISRSDITIILGLDFANAL